MYARYRDIYIHRENTSRNAQMENQLYRYMFVGLFSLYSYCIAYEFRRVCVFICAIMDGFNYVKYVTMLLYVRYNKFSMSVYVFKTLYSKLLIMGENL